MRFTPRHFTPVLLVALLLPLVAHAAVPVAPFQPFLGEKAWDDYNGDSASNGRSTLAVWENAYHPYTTTHSVHARFLGGDALPIELEQSAIAPAVATDGQAYLVAYGIASSRFNTHPYANVMVRLVSADGAVGDRKAIHTSAIANGPSVSDVAWTGRYWMVAFSDGLARVAFLGLDLEPALPTLTLVAPDGGFSSAPQLVERDGQRWAVFSQGTRTEAVEIRPDGTAGRRHSIEVPAGLLTATASGDLFVYTASTAEGRRLASSTFDTATGFGPAVTTSVAGVLEDVRSWNGAVLAIVREDRFPSSWVDAVVLTARGAVAETRRLLSEEKVWTVSVGDGVTGPLLLVSSAVEAVQELDTRTGLYAWPLASLPSAPLARASREIVSSALHGGQRSPLIGSNGQSLVAFWTQTIDASGHVESFSRPISKEGTPTGEIVRLPFVIGLFGDVEFDGERFILVWDSGSKILAASVSADGRTAGAAVEVGNGRTPRVAARDGVTFVVWTFDGTVRGTPLRRDASPEVPGGFPILPTFTSGQSEPDIAALDDGFLLLWKEDGVKSIVIGPSGTPRSSSQLTTDRSAETIVVASEAGGVSLAAWRQFDRGILYAYGADGRPFEPFDPRWGDWSPVSISSAGKGRYAVAFMRGNSILVADVIMSGGYITSLAQPRFLARAGVSNFSAIATESGVVAIWADGSRVYVGTGEELRRRSVVRR